MKKPNRNAAHTALRDSCLDYLYLKGMFAWANETQGQWDPVKQVYRAFRGLKGVSDILGILPWSGQLLAVECKTGSGKLTKDQANFLQKVRDNGGVGLVITNLEELIIRFEYWRLENARKNHQTHLTETFIRSLLNPEENGLAVSAHIRDEARKALGRKPVET